jgi:hypothetical protein
VCRVCRPGGWVCGDSWVWWVGVLGGCGGCVGLVRVG